jgi:hypothetical protein
VEEASPRKRIDEHTRVKGTSELACGSEVFDGYQKVEEKKK